MTAHKKILILDFGSQYTQLIARRVRETHVYCELHPWDMRRRRSSAISIRRASSFPADRIRFMKNETPKAPQVVFELGVPVLGICYGMQTMAAQLGGSGGKRQPCANSVMPRFVHRDIRTCCATSRTGPTRKVTACLTCG